MGKPGEWNPGGGAVDDVRYLISLERSLGRTCTKGFFAKSLAGRRVPKEPVLETV